MTAGITVQHGASGTGGGGGGGGALSKATQVGFWAAPESTWETTTGIIDANNVYALPFLGGGWATTQIEINVTTAAAAGSKAVLGIYSAGSNGYPASLLASTAELAIDVTGRVRGTITSTTLTAGELYFLAITASAQVTITGFTRHIIRFGWRDASLGAPQVWRAARTYDGTLPATYPTGATDIATSYYIGVKR